MTSTGQGETTDGYAEEAARCAREAAAQLDDVVQMLRELAAATADPEVPTESIDQAMRGVQAGVLGAHTSALLSLSARLGQLVAVLAERPLPDRAAAGPTMWPIA